MNGAILTHNRRALAVRSQKLRDRLKLAAKPVKDANYVENRGAGSRAKAQ